MSQKKDNGLQEKYMNLLYINNDNPPLQNTSSSLNLSNGENLNQLAKKANTLQRVSEIKNQKLSNPATLTLEDVIVRRKKPILTLQNCFPEADSLKLITSPSSKLLTARSNIPIESQSISRLGKIESLRDLPLTTRNFRKVYSIRESTRTENDYYTESREIDKNDITNKGLLNLTQTQKTKKFISGIIKNRATTLRNNSPIIKSNPLLDEKDMLNKIDKKKFNIIGGTALPSLNTVQISQRVTLPTITSSGINEIYNDVKSITNELLNIIEKKYDYTLKTCLEVYNADRYCKTLKIRLLNWIKLFEIMFIQNDKQFIANPLSLSLANMSSSPSITPKAANASNNNLNTENFLKSPINQKNNLQYNFGNTPTSNNTPPTNFNINDDILNLLLNEIICISEEYEKYIYTIDDKLKNLAISVKNSHGYSNTSGAGGCGAGSSAHGTGSIGCGANGSSGGGSVNSNKDMLNIYDMDYIDGLYMLIAYNQAIFDRYTHLPINSNNSNSNIKENHNNSIYNDNSNTNGNNNNNSTGHSTNHGEGDGDNNGKKIYIDILNEVESNIFKFKLNYKVNKNHNAKAYECYEKLENIIKTLNTSMSNIQQRYDAAIQENQKLMMINKDLLDKYHQNSQKLIKLEKAANTSLPNNMSSNIGSIKENYYLKKLEELQHEIDYLKAENDRLSSKNAVQTEELTKYKQISETSQKVMVSKSTEININFDEHIDQKRLKITQILTTTPSSASSLASVIIDGAIQAEEWGLYFINMIYSDKIMTDIHDDQEKIPRQMLVDYVVEWFLKRFGLYKVSEELLRDFTSTIRFYYDHNERYRIFCDLCGIKVEEAIENGKETEFPKHNPPSKSIINRQKIRKEYYQSMDCLNIYLKLIYYIKTSTITTAIHATQGHVIKLIPLPYSYLIPGGTCINTTGNNRNSNIGNVNATSNTNPHYSANGFNQLLPFMNGVDDLIEADLCKMIMIALLDEENIPSGEYEIGFGNLVKNDLYVRVMERNNQNLGLNSNGKAKQKKRDLESPRKRGTIGVLDNNLSTAANQDSNLEYNLKELDDDKYLRFDTFCRYVLDIIADYRISQIEQIHTILKIHKQLPITANNPHHINENSISYDEFNNAIIKTMPHKSINWIGHAYYNMIKIATSNKALMGSLLSSLIPRLSDHHKIIYLGDSNKVNNSSIFIEPGSSSPSSPYFPTTNKPNLQLDSSQSPNQQLLNTSSTMKNINNKSPQPSSLSNSPKTNFIRTLTTNQISTTTTMLPSELLSKSSSLMTIRSSLLIPSKHKTTMNQQQQYANKTGISSQLIAIKYQIYDCVSSYMILLSIYEILKPRIVKFAKSDENLETISEELYEDLMKLPHENIKCHRYDGLNFYTPQELVNYLEACWKKLRTVITLCLKNQAYHI